MALRENPPEVARTRRTGERGRYGADSSQEGKDFIPYSTQELKYLCVMWDEAGRHCQPGRRHRNLFGGAVGVILTGWLIYGLGLSCCAHLGGILMIAGVLIGAWQWLKFRRHQRHFPLDD